MERESANLVGRATAARRARDERENHLRRSSLFCRLVPGPIKGIVNPLVYYSGLYAGSAALLKFAGFVFFLWLAQTLSINDYATWGLLYALQTAVASFGLVGIVEAMVGLFKVHRTADDQRRLFAVANSAFLVTSGFSMVLATIIFAAFVERTDSPPLSIPWVVASGALLAYSSLQAQIVRLEERHTASLFFNFVIPLAGLVGSVIVVAVQRTVQSFFIGSTIGLAVSLVGARMCQLGFYRFAHSTTECRPILSRISPFIAVTFLGWLGGYGNNYVIKLFFDSAEVAKFTLAFMICSIMQLIATAMNQVWSPRFYRLIHEFPFDQVERQNRRFFRLQAVVLGLAGGLLIALFPVGVGVLGGNLAQYQSIGLELALLVAAYVVLVPWWQCQNYFLAYDEGPIVMRILVGASLVGVTILLGSISLLGPLGIYIGFLAQMALRSAGALIVARVRCNLRINISWDGILIGVALTLGGLALSAHGFGR